MIQSLVTDFEKQWRDRSVLQYPPPPSMPPYPFSGQQQQQFQPRIIVQRNWEQGNPLMGSQIANPFLNQQQQQQQQLQYQSPFLEFNDGGGGGGGGGGPAAKKAKKNRWGK